MQKLLTRLSLCAAVAGPFLVIAPARAQTVAQPQPLPGVVVRQPAYPIVRLNLPDLVIDASASAGPRLVNVAIIGYSPGILFTVKNQGTAAATQWTMTMVSIQGLFNQFSSSRLTPPLNPGQSVQLVVPVPDWAAAYFSCDGRSFTVDATQIIFEGNESNNRWSKPQDGLCYF